MSLWRDLRERNVARLVELWEEFRERRLFRISAGYLAGGWLVLQGADMLAGRDLISELAYRLVLVGYLAGIPASLIVGWYHGEKGAQRLTLREIGLLTVVGAAAVAAAAGVVQEHRTAPETLAANSTLDMRRVAVLYYEDTSGRADLADVTTGLTESLIEKLQQVNQLEVISPHGVRRFRDDPVSPDSVARALGVGTVISGSVSGHPDELRITTRLLDGESGAEVDENVITVARDELLPARDSISTRLSRDLRKMIGSELSYRTRRAETRDVTAWILLQRGERLLREARTAARHGQVDSALVRFRRADSTFAASGRTDSVWVDPVVGRARNSYRMSRALLEVAGDRHGALRALDVGLQHAERALERDPGHPEALELRGTLRYWKWHVGRVTDPEERLELIEAAREDLEAAVAADPALATAYSTLSHLRYQPPVRDLVGVTLAARRAYEADAYLEQTDRILWYVFRAHQDLGQFDRARRWCEEGRKRFPADFRFRLCRLRLLTTGEHEPDVGEAWRLVDQVDSLAPADRRPFFRTQAEMYAAGVLARSGFADSARSVLSSARSRVTPKMDPTNFLLGVEAYARVLLGDEERAIELLSRYVSANPGHEFSVNGEISWRWRSLQDNAEFRRIRRAR